MWLKLERAREEIRRTKLEASRLRTWIVQDGQKCRALINQLEPIDKLLAAELRDRLGLQELVNQRQIRALDRMDRLRNRRRDPWDMILATRFRGDAPQEELIAMDPDSDVDMPPAIVEPEPEQELIAMEPDPDDDLPSPCMPPQVLTGVDPDVEANMLVKEDLGLMDIGLARDAATVLELGRLRGVIGLENAEEDTGDSEGSEDLGSEGGDLEDDDGVDEETGERMVQLDMFLDKEDI
jgi:hypothetical protein